MQAGVQDFALLARADHFAFGSRQASLKAISPGFRYLNQHQPSFSGYWHAVCLTLSDARQPHWLAANTECM